MKKFLLSAGLTLFLISLNAQETITITGKVLDTFEEPIPGANVILRDSTIQLGAVTDFDGNYTLENVPVNGSIIVSYIGYTSVITEVNGQSTINFILFPSVGLEENVVAITSFKNYWNGAKVGYNIIGEFEKNLLVGSASLNFNLFKDYNRESRYLDIAMVGSLGSFSIKESEIPRVPAKLKKLAQSINGISLGFGSVLDLNPDNNDDDHRVFLNTGLRYNDFKDIGEDEETVNFFQWATSLGYEFEGLKFIKQQPCTFGVSLNNYIFDSDKYQQVFEEDKSMLFAAEANIIIGIWSATGILINGTYPFDSSPIYTAGIIFK